MKKVLSAYFLLLGLLFGITPLWSQVHFENIAPQVRVDVSYGNSGFGGGVSFYDFDDDGWDDLSLASESGRQLSFFRNLNGLGFALIPQMISHTGEAEQLTWVDIDNDGDQDLFVSAYLSGNKLFRNDSTLGFTDITVQAGLPTDSMPTFAVCWGDYNRDGWVDLYLTNRQEPAYPYANYLFRNLGNGSFQNMTGYSGTADPGKEPLAVLFVDINNDLWPDIYIAQDKFAGNTLLRNNGDGTFSDISVSSGSNSIVDGMGITAGDYDADGDLDLYFSNSPLGGNVLLRNNGNETFSNVSTLAGVSHNGTCWGVNFFDYENDGDLDLYSSSVWFPFFNNPASALFINQGSGSFTYGSGLGFAGDSALSFSNAIGDIDRDGHPEIGVNNVLPYNFHLWKNSGNSGNHWLKVRLRGVQSNRNGIGSFVEVYAQGQKQIRYTHCGTGYLAQNSAWEMFGLNTTAFIDSIVVRWPSGVVNRRFQVPADQHLEIVESGPPVTPSTGLADLIAPEAWSVLPNPSEGQFQLLFHTALPPSAKWEILDLQGKCLASAPILFQSGMPQQTAPRQLAQGMYLLRLSLTDGRSGTKKLVIR